MFSAIRVPKEFLGLGDSGFLDSSMKKKDLRYARMVNRVQDLVCRVINEMVEYKAMKTEFAGKIPEYKVNYTETSTVEEIENLEELNTRLGIATALSDFIGKNPHVDPDKFAEYIINDLMQIEGSHDWFDSTKIFQKDETEDMGDDDNIDIGGENNNASEY